MDHRSNLFSNSCIQFLPSHLIFFFSFCLVQLTMNTSILFILAIFMVSAVNSRSLPEGKNISQTFLTPVFQLTCITFCKWLGMQLGSFKFYSSSIKVILYQSKKQIISILKIENINYLVYNGTTEGWCGLSKNCIKCKLTQSGQEKKKKKKMQQKFL